MAKAVEKLSMPTDARVSGSTLTKPCPEAVTQTAQSGTSTAPGHVDLARVDHALVTTNARCNY